MKTYYVGVPGLLIEADCHRDISTATDTTFLVQYPSGKTKTWTATPAVKDGVTRLLQYLTVADDLDEAGIYRIHAHVQLGAYDGPGLLGKFLVKHLFEE